MNGNSVDLLYQKLNLTKKVNVMSLSFLMILMIDVFHKSGTMKFLHLAKSAKSVNPHF